MKKKLIETPVPLADIAPEEYSQRQEVTSVCSACGGTVTRTLREVSYKKDWNVCDSCSKKSPTDVVMLPTKDVAELAKGFSCATAFSFECESCGKPVTKRLVALKKSGFFCKACSAKNTFRDRHGTENPFADPNFQAEKRERIAKKYGSLEAYEGRKLAARAATLRAEGIENVFQREGVKAKARATRKARYGDENFNNRDLAASTKEATHGDRNFNNRDLAKKTFVERHGADCTMRSPGLAGKVRDTNSKRYGGASPFSSPEVRTASRETKSLRYGNPNFVNSEKSRATMKERYGDWFSATDACKDGIRQTCMDRYGVPSVFQSAEFKLASRASFLSRYGTANNMSSVEGHAAWVDAFRGKYGVDYPAQVPEIRKKILGRQGMSGPEKKMAEFLANRGIPHEYNYYANGKHFDFAVFDRSGDLKALIEIDGEYFHGLVSDVDGKHVRGDHDCERFLTAPDGVSLVVCDSRKVEQAFSEVLKALDISYEAWVRSTIETLPPEFPYPEYSETRLRNDWKKLREFTYNKDSRLGISLVRQFHKSIWSAKVGGKPSPVEAWSDKGLLEKCVRNRFIYSSSLSSQAIADGFNVCKIAPKVSVFNPALAKRLVERYLSEFDEVFDPFSGFSGRMLGVTASGKKYVGRDISGVAIGESTALAKFLGIDVDLERQDVLTAKGAKRQCLFTCSPYGEKESWGLGLSGKSCDEWIDACLDKYDCDAYLFVVDRTERYRDRVVETLKNRSHFCGNDELVVLIREGRA